MRRYSVTAFVTGAAVMIGEIAAARAIAPHFGTSIIVWTNVIGIILVALSVGYWIGGRLSERRPDERVLGAIIALAGFLFIIPAFATRWIAGTLIADLFRIGSGFLVVLIGSFFAVILLFALPIALLGMVSPFLVKLASRGRADIGAVAGRLYAISTIGSLVGTFLPTLVLLPTFGTRRTMLLAAAVLIVLGVWLATRRRAPALLGILVLVLVLVLVPDRPIPWFLGGNTIAQRDSRYQLLRIVDHFSPSTLEGEREGEAQRDRFLVFNEGLGIQSRAVFDPAAIEGYSPVVAAVPAFFPSPHILILGNAGGTIANLMQRFFPDDRLDITGVELDPAVTAITAAHFPTPLQPYPVVHADSRVFLRGADARYDIIVADAYTSQLTIPPHLVTREFFDLVRTRLTPGGVLVANVNAPSRDSVLLRTIEQTIAAAFPHVVIGKAGETWNYLILASDQPIRNRGSAIREFQLPESARTEIRRFLGTVEVVTVDERHRTFTDDWAPLELFTDLEIFEAIRNSSS